MPNVAVDSGVLYALFDQSDAAHARAAKFLAAPSQTLIANLPVLTEVAYLLNYSGDAQAAFLTWAKEALSIDQQTVADLERIVAIMIMYADLPADFADASLLALCERSGVSEIATLDSDFDVYRLSNGRSLINVFAP